MRLASLMYHDVADREDPDRSGFPGRDAARYKLGKELFADHLEAVKSGPAPVVSIGHFDASDSGESVVLTFDDGGVSALEVIAPMLEDHGWRGLFFVTTDYLGVPGFLDGDMVRELNERGHTIGSHSCSHPEVMSSLGEDALLDEWSRSCAVLADLIEGPVVTASVPNGYYSPKVARAASRAGVRFLFTSEPTVDAARVEDCLVLGRYMLQSNSPASEVAGLLRSRSLTRLKQKSLWDARKLVKGIAGDSYLKLRMAILSRHN